MAYSHCEKGNIIAEHIWTYLNERLSCERVPWVQDPVVLAYDKGYSQAVKDIIQEIKEISNKLNSNSL